MADTISRDERFISLDRFAVLVENRSLDGYDLKPTTGSLTQDLRFVFDALRRDVDVWRTNRAFHAFHVPSLLVNMSMLDDIDDLKSISDNERHHHFSAIHRATQLVSSARKRIEQSVLTEAKVELSVLANYSPAYPPEFEEASLFERTRNSVLLASNSTLQRVRNSVETAPNVIGAVKDGILTSIDRAHAVPLLLPICSGTLAGMVPDNLTKPVGMSLQACGKATGAGVGLGVVAAVF